MLTVYICSLYIYAHCLLTVHVSGLVMYILCCKFAAVVAELISSECADTGAPTLESQCVSP